MYLNTPPTLWDLSVSRRVTFLPRNSRGFSPLPRTRKRERGTYKDPSHGTSRAADPDVSLVGGAGSSEGEGTRLWVSLVDFTRPWGDRTEPTATGTVR